METFVRRHFLGIAAFSIQHHFANVPTKVQMSIGTAPLEITAVILIPVYKVRTA